MTSEWKSRKQQNEVQQRNENYKKRTRQKLLGLKNTMAVNQKIQ